MAEKAQVEIGSRNFFKDMGFKNPEEEQAKVELARQINIIIKRRRWNQQKAAENLKLTQPKISLLSRGQLKNFSLEKLMHILNQLNQNIEIVVHDCRSSRKKGDLQVVFVGTS